MNIDMDRVIEKKRGVALVFSRRALPVWLGVLVVALVFFLLFRDNRRVLRVEADSLTTGEVVEGEFNDYIRVRGQVQPMVSIQLSPLEGGVVDRIVVEEGASVRKGDPILVLSNEGLDLQILNAEADLAEKENMLRNTMISMEQQRLSVNQEKLQLAMEVRRYRRTWESQRQLFEEELISREDYLRAKEDYELYRGKYELVFERAVQDSLYRGVQVDQMEESLSNMKRNMVIIRRRKDNLVIKAPIDGELGLLDVALGQSVSQGMKIGQINNLDSYKIEVQVDEHYIDRIMPGLVATFKRGEENFRVVVRKVYPEVRDGKFKADFKFVGERPDNIRTGQSYDLNLQLGQPEECILIPRGTFYQNTGGHWIFVLSPDGSKAVRREIRIGRQNPRFYEVLDGLKAGERVVVSGYDRFGENDCLEIK